MRFSNRDEKTLKGLEKVSLPARRPKPIPAVTSRLPNDLVPTIYSEEYHPVPMKSLSPKEIAGRYVPSSKTDKCASKLLSQFTRPWAKLPPRPWPPYRKETPRRVRLKKLVHEITWF